MAAPKFKAASKASCGSLAEAFAKFGALTPKAAPKALNPVPKGKAAAKSLAANRDGALTVLGREVTSTHATPVRVPADALLQEDFRPMMALGVVGKTPVTGNSLLQLLRQRPADTKETNVAMVAAIVGAYGSLINGIDPWALAVNVIAANSGIIPPKYIRGLNDDEYTEVNNYDFVTGLDLLNIDTTESEDEALKELATKLGCLFTSLILSIGQANYVHHTKLYNRLLANIRVVDPPRAVLDAMEKLHKIVDQRVLSIHGMVSYYPDKQAFDTWTLPDVVLARPSAPLIPVLKFVAGDLALDNRIKEALERPASPNLRTLMAFAPSIDEMLANSIYPGSPEVNLRLHVDNRKRLRDVSFQTRVGAEPSANSANSERPFYGRTTCYRVSRMGVRKELVCGQRSPAF